MIYQVWFLASKVFNQCRNYDTFYPGMFLPSSNTMVKACLCKKCHNCDICTKTFEARIDNLLVTYFLVEFFQILEQ